MENLKLPGFSQIPVSETRPEESKVRELDVSKMKSVWEKIERGALKQEIGEGFPIPEDSIPAALIFLKAELTQMTPEWLSPDYGYGRKVACKYIIGPFFTEYLMVKETKGSVPVYFFSYPKEDPQNLFIGKPMWSPQTPEDKAKTEEERFEDFMGRILNDTREVRLARIHSGSNVKGKEFETNYYFQSGSDNELRLTTVLHEEASEIITQTQKGIDFALRGCILGFSDENVIRVAAFRTLQLSSWKMASVTLGGYYENGALQGFLISEAEQETLPVRKAFMEKDPASVLFSKIAFDRESLNLQPNDNQREVLDKHNLDVRITQPSPSTVLLEVRKRDDPGATPVITSIPVILNSQEYLNAVQGKSLLPIKHEIGYQLPLSEKTVEKEIALIRVDPEVDSDLNIILNRLITTHGSHLKKLILYGSIARGQKRLGSDIDILAILTDEADVTMGIEGFISGPIFHEVLGSHYSPGLAQQLKKIELHTIRQSDFEKPTKEPLRDFLDNISAEAITLWERAE